MKTFFCVLLLTDIFSVESTNCWLARGQILPLILADFGTHIEKSCPPLFYGFVRCTLKLPAKARLFSFCFIKNLPTLIMQPDFHSKLLKT